MNNIKKWIENYGATVLFSANTSTLRSIFSSNVENYLGNLVKMNGLYDFRFIMD